MRTVPVNQSAGPFADGCAPARLISICLVLLVSIRRHPPAPCLHQIESAIIEVYWLKRAKTYKLNF